MTGCGHEFEPMGVRILQYHPDTLDEVSMNDDVFAKYYHDANALRCRLRIGQGQQVRCSIDGSMRDEDNQHIVRNDRIEQERIFVNSADIQIWICSNRILAQPISCEIHGTKYDVSVFYCIGDIDRFILHQSVFFGDAFAIRCKLDKEIKDASELVSTRTLEQVQLINETSPELIKKALKNNLDGELRNFGLILTDLQIAELPAEFICPTCKSTINKGDRLCRNGHRQYWCPYPDCGRQIDNPATFNCPDCGNLLLWCIECHSFIVPVKGRFCPVHGISCYSYDIMYRTDL